MKSIPIKLYALTLFTLLLFAPLIQANELGQLDQEHRGGVLHDIKHGSGGNIQIQLDGDWYTIDKNSDIYICNEKITEKSTDDLAEFTGWYFIVPAPSDEMINQVHAPCQ